MELHNFCKENAIHMVQGSPEWKEYRKGIVGGSEIGTIVSGKSLGTLAKSKLGLSSFNGNEYTRWGSAFESISRHLMCDLLNCKIWETGNLPVLRDDEGNVIHGISPDGFAILRDPSHAINSFNAIFNRPCVTLPFDEHVAMFEFKSPVKRKIGNDIPTSYVKQILSEVASMPMAEYCLYVDTEFKLRDLANRVGIVRGWFAILSKVGSFMGFNIDEYSIDEIFRDWKSYDVWQGQPEYENDDFDKSNIRALRKYMQMKDLKLIGIIPWYLNDALIAPLYKDPDFPYDQRQKIITFISKLNSLRNKNDAEKILGCIRF